MTIQYKAPNPFRYVCRSFSKILVLTPILIATSLHAKSTHCLIVRGTHGDPILNHVHYLREDQNYLMGKKCEIFNSWTNLIEYYNQNIDRLNADQNQVFILQATHGSEGGITNCGSGENVSAEDLLKNLKKISSKFQTAATLQSCYSGDVLKRKLTSDSDTDPSLPNLCLATASVFGMPANNDRSFFFSEINSGETMEDIFLDFPDGLISSAAWDSSGITDYLRNQDAAKAFRLLKTLTTPRWVEPNCAASVDVCGLPDIKTSDLDFLFHVLQPTSHDLALKGAHHLMPGAKGTSSESSSESREFEILRRILAMDAPDWNVQRARCSAYLSYNKVLHNFVKASLKQPKLEASMDSQRRKACRSFVFNSNEPKNNKKWINRKFIAALQNRRIDELRSLIASNKNDISFESSPTLAGGTPIDYSVSKENLQALEVMIEAGININYTNVIGTTPLYSAASLGHLDMVKALVKAGAEVNKPANNTFTPLLIACNEGHLEVVRYLVENGAKINKPEQNGFTPLAQSVYQGHLEVAKYLLSKGADPRVVGNDGRSILDLAEKPKNKTHQAELFQLIREAIEKAN